MLVHAGINPWRQSLVVHRPHPITGRPVSRGSLHSHSEQDRKNGKRELHRQHEFSPEADATV